DQILKMQGQGNAPVREGISGDLNIKINVTPHKILMRSGIDVLLDLHLPYTTLILGEKVEIPTVGGTTELNIPELTQGGTVMRLKNKGIKMLNRDVFGDLLVTLKAEFPKVLDRKTKEIIKSLQKDTSINLFPKYKKFNESKK
ncbi:MAG: DnaJ C-terminal domain-containing protein, partial [Clostridia bacterium]|nr:DnaJ C-terminal domain-containing protein [Clostridia bacterium]